MARRSTAVRTVISLPAADKRWLDHQARRRRVPMTRLVQEAVQLLRRQGGDCPDGLDELLARTRGLWRRGDGLAWQRRLRDEW
jgi:hypothetical protein